MKGNILSKSITTSSKQLKSISEVSLARLSTPINPTIEFRK